MISVLLFSGVFYPGLLYICLEIHAVTIFRSFNCGVLFFVSKLFECLKLSKDLENLVFQKEIV